MREWNDHSAGLPRSRSRISAVTRVKPSTRCALNAKCQRPPAPLSGGMVGGRAQDMCVRVRVLEASETPQKRKVPSCAPTLLSMTLSGLPSRPRPRRVEAERRDRWRHPAARCRGRTVHDGPRRAGNKVFWRSGCAMCTHPSPHHSSHHPLSCYLHHSPHHPPNVREWNDHPAGGRPQTARMLELPSLDPEKVDRLGDADSRRGGCCRGCRLTRTGRRTHACPPHARAAPRGRHVPRMRRATRAPTHPCPLAHSPTPQPTHPPTYPHPPTPTRPPSDTRIPSTGITAAQYVASLPRFANSLSLKAGCVSMFVDGLSYLCDLGGWVRV